MPEWAYSGMGSAHIARRIDMFLQFAIVRPREGLSSICLSKMVDRQGFFALNPVGVSRRWLLHNYEIRIVRKGHAAPFIYACPHASDYAAVRRAQSLADDGDDVEVWRELDCVYSTNKAMRIHA